MLPSIALYTLLFVNILRSKVYLTSVIIYFQYLELRYGSAGLRKMGTTLILVNLCVYMGMCLYAPSLALATVTNISPINSIIIVGVIVTFYITVVSK